MDVITRTTFHLKARNRSGTDDPAETGPESEPAPGRKRHRNHVHTDSMSFNEFHFFDEFHLNRVSNRGLGDKGTYPYPLSHMGYPSGSSGTKV